MKKHKKKYKNKKIKVLEKEYSKTLKKVEKKERDLRFLYEYLDELEKKILSEKELFFRH